MPPGRNWPKKRWLFSRRYRIEVHFGPPIWPGIDEHRTDVMARVRTFLEREAGESRSPLPSVRRRRRAARCAGRLTRSSVAL